MSSSPGSGRKSSHEDDQSRVTIVKPNQATHVVLDWLRKKD